MYWLIALPARFGSVTSIAVTMGAVNTLAIVGCVALARRRGGLVLMVATAVGIALMCQSLPSEAMHDIWNPAAGLFPFLLLIFVVAAACWTAPTIDQIKNSPGNLTMIVRTVRTRGRRGVSRPQQ